MSEPIDISKEIKKRSYLTPHDFDSKNHIVKLIDGTLLVISISLKNILFQNDNTPGAINADVVVNSYSLPEIRQKRPSTTNPDMEFEVLECGYLKFNSNGFLVEIIPVVVQITKTGRFQLNGDVEYAANIQAKYVLNKKTP